MFPVNTPKRRKFKRQKHQRNINKYRNCNRKTRYESDHEAYHFINKSVALGRVKPGELIVYECVLCEGFHIGHPRKKQT